MGRFVDARLELRLARAELRGGDPLELQKIDYALTLCALQLELLGAGCELDSFSKRYPEAPYENDILFLSGLIEASDGDEAEALRLLEEVVPNRLNERDQQRYNIRMGYMLFMRGEYEQAKQHLSTIEEGSEFYPHALYCDSYINYAEGRYEEAKGGFERLKEVDTFAPIAPYYLMQLEFELKNYDRSIEYGLELLESSMEQKQVRVVRTLAEAYFRLNRYEEALELIDRYASIGGELGREEYYIKGFSLHQLARYEAAIEPLKKACGADDEMTQNASFHLANCYIHTGDKSGAKAAFSMAANDKFNAQIAEEALFNYAKLQYELGSGPFNEAINLLTRYVNTYDNPERLAIMRTLLVAAYYNTRDYATAYKNIALIKNPDGEIKAAKQKITYLRGLEQYNAKNYNDSKSYLSESIGIGVTAKQIALATYWLGEIDFLMGNYKGAVERYNYYLARAPKSDPTTVEAQYSIAYALLMQGNSQSALQYFQRYVSSSMAVVQLKADSYSRIGDIYYGMRNFKEASSNYQKAISMGGNGENYARYQLAIIKGVQGSTKGKIEELKKINSAAAGEEYLDDAHYELGRSYINIERYSDATESLKSFLESYPSSPLYAQALSDLGVAYINMGDSKSSLEYYDRAIKAAPQSQVAKDAMQGVREIHVGKGDAEAYFKYAESIGMEGDLNAVTRDSLSFASARGLYFAGEKSKDKLSSAAKALDGYIKGYPKGYYLNDALFFLSDSYIKMGDSKKAIATLEKLGERGQSQYSETLYNKLSQLCSDGGLYEKAASASRKLYDVAKSDKVRHTAMSRYVDATMMVGDKAALKRMSDEVITLGEKNVGADALIKAKYIRATELRERGEWNEARVLYAELAKGETEFRSEANYYLIEDKFRSKAFEESEKLIFAFSEMSSADPYWLARAFILLGDIYVAKEDNFQARATYQSIVDGYSNQSDGIIEEAKGKIGELK